MKKLIILLLVMMAAVFSVDAADSTTPTTTKTYGTGDTLTIKAYKKDKSAGPIYTLKVVDALTGSLDDITQYSESSREINIDDYVNKFIGTFNDKVGLSKKAIFSIHVGGNVKSASSESNFEVSVTFGDFALYTWDNDNKVWAKTKNENEVISVQYFMQDMNYFFTSTGTTSAEDESSYEETISSDTEDQNVTVDSLNSSKTLSFSWNVWSDNTALTTTQNYWDVEVMFAMIIDSSTYEEKNNGTYRAPITITLTYEA
jgi:hypothetical protein